MTAAGRYIDFRPPAAETPQATPPALNWRWFNGLDAARPQRQPQQPSLIRPGAQDLEAFDTLAGLAAALVDLLDGRAPILTRTVATFDGYDTFPAWSIHACPASGRQAETEPVLGLAEGEARGTAGPQGIRPPGAAWIGCIAVQQTGADAVLAAIAEIASTRRAA